MHFLPNHPPEALGAKAAAANLSDLAAVGAWPAWILVSLGAPGRTPLGWVEALYRGMRAVMAPYGCRCVGGDCVRAERLTINIAAGGACDPRANVPLRSRARPGQALYVTGTLGDSGAGLWLLRNAAKSGGQAGLPGARGRPRDARILLERHQRPTPRVQAGLAIARACPDAAMMDVSDGLATDLARMARASGCGFELSLPTLPLSAPLRRVARCLPLPPESFALFGGEDYELLFTTAVPLPRWRGKVERGAAGRGGAGSPLGVTCIGRAVEREGVRYLDAAGRPETPPGSPFEHF